MRKNSLSPTAKIITSIAAILFIAMGFLNPALGGNNSAFASNYAAQTPTPKAPKEPKAKPTVSPSVSPTVSPMESPSPNPSPGDPMMTPSPSPSPSPTMAPGTN